MWFASDLVQGEHNGKVQRSGALQRASCPWGAEGISGSFRRFSVQFWAVHSPEVPFVLGRHAGFAVVMKKENSYQIEAKAVFNAAISALSRGSKWLRALQLAKVMPGQGIEPGIVTSNALCSACGRQSAWIKATSLLQEALRLNLKLGAVFLGTSAAFLERGKQWTLCLNLLLSFCTRDVALEPITCNSAFSSCEKSGQWPAALSLMTSTCHIRILLDVISWSAAISACEKAEQWLQALSLFRIVQACSSPNSFTHSAILSSCEKASRWQQASQLLHVQKFSLGRFETLHCNSVLSSCRTCSSWRVALVFLQDLSNLSGLRVNSISFNSVLRSLLADEGLNRWQDGQLLMQRLLARGMQVTIITGNTLMSLYDKARQWSHAQDLLAHKLSLYGLLVDIMTYNGALSAFEKGSQWPRAQWQLTCMLKYGPQPQIVTLGGSIAALGAAQLWEHSLLRFGSMGEFRLKANSVAFGAVLNACDRGQSWKAALALVLAASRDRAELGAVEFNSAITACSSSHVTDHALACAREMLLRRVMPDQVTCNALLALYGRAGMWNEAICLLRKTPVPGLTSPPLAPDVLSYSAALAACAKGCRPYEAEGLLTTAKSSRIALDLQAISNAVSSFRQASLWQQALGLALAMDSMDAVLLELASGAAEVGGCPTSAVELLHAAASTAHLGIRDARC